MTSEAAATASLVELRDLKKIYGSGESEVRALAGVSFRIEAGEFVAVMGASGSGKSTCLNMLGCLDTATSGNYLFCGLDVGSLTIDQLALLRRHYLGFVFQGYNLLARTSALENVELPLVYRGVPAAERWWRRIHGGHPPPSFDRQSDGRVSALPHHQRPLDRLVARRAPSY